MKTGRPKVHYKRDRVVARTPPGLSWRITKLAKLGGVPANAWLVQALERAVEAEEKRRGISQVGPTVRRDPVKRVSSGP